MGNTSWVVGIVNRYCYFYLTKNALHVTDKLVHVPEKVSQRLNGRGKYLKRERAKRCEFRPKEERGQKAVEKNISKSDGGQINNTFKLKC